VDCLDFLKRDVTALGIAAENASNAFEGSGTFMMKMFDEIAN
jgi:hydroxyethylthiazole kinase-like sugar kinase family protein